MRNAALVMLALAALLAGCGGGSGLGLAIVKHVVEAAGGRVEARGAPAAGLEIRSVFP